MLFFKHLKNLEATSLTFISQSFPCFLQVQCSLPLKFVSIIYRLGVCMFHIRGFGLERSRQTLNSGQFCACSFINHRIVLKVELISELQIASLTENVERAPFTYQKRCLWGLPFKYNTVIYWGETIIPKKNYILFI